MLNIVSLNTNGARGNLWYIEYLIKNNDIMFCCEHWLNKYENNFFENINLNKEFNTIFYSPMIQVNNKGRPWGGSSWFFKKKIEILKHEILEDGISAVEIKYKNETFTLIGVDLASMSAKLEQKIKYRSQLLILQEKVISCRRENKRFIILGDTNADITRKRYFNDEKLVEFLKTNNCKSIKNENKNIDYTYCGMNHKSLIDHIIIDQDDVGITMKTLNNRLNTSDHLALQASIKMNRQKNAIEVIQQISEPPIRYISLNWKNTKSVENYESAVNENLRRIKINNIFKDENEAKSKIDEYYNNLTQSFVKAEEKITNELYKNKSSNKDWWTREMSTLKKELQKARMEERLWKDETSRENKRTAKRNFRRKQRRCVFIYEEKNNRKIENLFDKPSKEDFWKSLDKYKQCRKNADIN